MIVIPVKIVALKLRVKFLVIVCFSTVLNALQFSTARKQADHIKINVIVPSACTNHFLEDEDPRGREKMIGVALKAGFVLGFMVAFGFASSGVVIWQVKRLISKITS